MLPILMSGRVAAPLVLSLFSVLPALPLACRARVIGTTKWDLPGTKGELGVEGELGSRKADVTSTPPIPCVEIVFTDANGNEQGSWSGSIPAQDIPIPAGATHFSAKECDPDEEERMLAGPGGRLRRIDEWYFFGGPLEPKLRSGELSYAVTISATSRARAEDRLEELLADARQGAAALDRLPDGVFRIHYLTTVRLVDLDLVFEFFDDGAFQSLDMELNGVPEVRTLEDASTFAVGGWHAAVLTVPVAEFEAGAALGTPYHNDYVFDLRSGGEPCTLSGFWDYTLY